MLERIRFKMLDKLVNVYGDEPIRETKQGKLDLPC